jgi:AcrR family transcriptional regulator
MGRPRRYNPETEIAILVESAWSLLRRKPYKDLTIADILSTSGLSTRSFYRHFDSKDDVLWFIYRTEAAGLARVMERRLARASGPVDALVVWIDTILGLAFDTEAAERTTILRAAVKQIDPRLVPPRSDGTALFVGTLRKIIELGRSEGKFLLAQPEHDAWSINALVWDSIDALVEGQRSSRSRVRQHILRFSLPALGYDGKELTDGKAKRQN